MITVNDLDPKGNMYWPKDHMDKDFRGKILYKNDPKPKPFEYKFAKEYIGLGLSVINEGVNYDKGDTSWIRLDHNENEWVVLMHKLNFVPGNPGIPPTFGFEYNNLECQITGKKIGSGTVFTNDYK